MGAAVVVRAATGADLESLTGLFRQLGHPVTVDDVRNQIARMSPGRDLILLAEREDVPLGAVVVSTTPFPHEGGLRARVTGLVVDSGERRNGIGTLLLRAAEQAGRDLGCAVLELTTGVQREDAHRFYGREGYEKGSVRFVKGL